MKSLSRYFASTPVFARVRIYLRASFTIIIILFFLFEKTEAQVVDTLPAVELMSVKPVQDAKSATLNFKMNRLAIDRLNSMSVAEASRFFPAVQVKDYGGLGGLKTVSLRSLGANYTTVLYNGIPLADAQGGQIDLGRFSLNNAESIELSLQVPSNNLAPAKAFANAALINIASSQNFDSVGSVTAGLQVGSFQSFQPFISIKTKAGKKTFIQLYSDWQTSSGRFDFKDYENNSEIKTRTGADIEALHLETTLTHKISDSTYLTWQNYYYQSDRGLPGAIVYYANPRGDRLKNQSLFSQLQWKTFPYKKIAILSSLKYARDNKKYLDPDYPNSAGMLENDFQQQSVYGSLATEWNANGNISVHYAVDYVWDKLNRSDSFKINFAEPQRNSVFQNLGLVFRNHKLKFQADLLHNWINESVKTGKKPSDKSQLAPTFSANIKLSDIYVRASFKYLYRYPGFDELYFTNIGNVALLPETGRLYNLGIVGEENLKKANLKLNWSVDGYYQYVTDKILAIPRQNLFQWSMMNIGKAAVAGTDIFFSASLLHHSSQYALYLNYSFQHTRDLTDPASVSYKKQLAYSPSHSGNLRFAYSRKNFYAGYNLLFSGLRYRAGGELTGDQVGGFLLHDLYTGIGFSQSKPYTFSLKLEINNIFNHQYEIVRFYPMPGRNFRIGITINYKSLKHKK